MKEISLVQKDKSHLNREIPNENYFHFRFAAIVAQSYFKDFARKFN